VNIREILPAFALDTCNVIGSWEIPELAANLDIRSDLPSYKIFEHGEVVNEVNDVSEYWRDDLVTFP